MNILKTISKWWNIGIPCKHQMDARLELINRYPSSYRHSMIYHAEDTADGRLPRNDYYHTCGICGKKCKEFVLRMEIMRCYRLEKA